MFWHGPFPYNSLLKPFHVETFFEVSNYLCRHERFSSVTSRINDVFGYSSDRFVESKKTIFDLATSCVAKVELR